MSCNHKWSEECYAVVPSQVCVRCNAFEVEEEREVLVRDAYKRGAEAMREACVKAVLRSYDDDEPIVREVRALPIPEDK